MPDALQILREDHRKVKDIFHQFEDAEDQQTKKSLVDQAVLELTVHAKLEEEIFYPAVRSEGDTEDLIDEAEEEHHVAEMLMDELRGMKPSDGRWEAKVKVLAESVKHHIEEEEANALPKAAELGPEALQRIGQEMEMRRPSLMQKAQRMGSRRTATSRSGSRATGGTRARPTARRTTRANTGRTSTRRTTSARRTTTTGRAAPSRGTRATSTGGRGSPASRNGTGRGRTTSGRSTASRARAMRTSTRAAQSRGTGRRTSTSRTKTRS